jgi:hypothetical protein
MYKPHKVFYTQHDYACVYAYAHKIPFSKIFSDGRHITQWFNRPLVYPAVR